MSYEAPNPNPNSNPQPKMARPIRRICVFCGSIEGNKTIYQDAAIELGKELVSRNIDLVSRNIDLVGGSGSGSSSSSVDLMGLVSQAAYNGGRHVPGVIHKTLMPRELNGETVGEVKAIADMYEEMYEGKEEMARNCDAFIVLPGDYKTVAELFEVITLARHGIHDKPVGLLNVDGFYNKLLLFIDKAVDEGFATPNARHILVSAPTANELIKKLEEHVPCHERVA